MKNQKGITLIALVVTIVVLLILAGTAIAMLQGDNGIITNAQNAKAANTEAEVVDKIKMAYSTINTIVISKSSTDPEYNPQETETEKGLAQTVATELELGTLSGTSVSANGYTLEYTASSHQIKITYADSTFKADVEPGTPDKISRIEVTLTIQSNKVEMSPYTTQIKY